ncbi:hypothetical protein BJ968_004673 [Kineococcus aurantiacus]|uniref:Uncharacterized protein n=1 Tax=Kineococcus aurantiacus TaxID=37633 RepID=A0A7Y9DQX7_9ACTN|nr:hypothetical protein [Kineococcus aurantiacus]
MPDLPRVARLPPQEPRRARPPRHRSRRRRGRRGSCARPAASATGRRRRRRSRRSPPGPAQPGRGREHVGDGDPAPASGRLIAELAHGPGEVERPGDGHPTPSTASADPRVRTSRRTTAVARATAASAAPPVAPPVASGGSGSGSRSTASTSPVRSSRTASDVLALELQADGQRRAGPDRQGGPRLAAGAGARAQQRLPLLDEAALDEPPDDVGHRPAGSGRWPRPGRSGTCRGGGGRRRGRRPGCSRPPRAGSCLVAPAPLALAAPLGERLWDRSQNDAAHPLTPSIHWI